MSVACRGAPRCCVHAPSCVKLCQAVYSGSSSSSQQECKLNRACTGAVRITSAFHVHTEKPWLPEAGPNCGAIASKHWQRAHLSCTAYTIWGHPASSPLNKAPTLSNKHRIVCVCMYVCVCVYRGYL